MTDLNKDRKGLNFSILLLLTVLLKTLDPQIGDSLCSEMSLRNDTAILFGIFLDGPSFEVIIA